MPKRALSVPLVTIETEVLFTKLIPELLVSDAEMEGRAKVPTGTTTGLPKMAAVEVKAKTSASVRQIEIAPTSGL